MTKVRIPNLPPLAKVPSSTDLNADNMAYWSTTITNSSDDNYTYPWFLFV